MSQVIATGENEQKNHWLGLWLVGPDMHKGEMMDSTISRQNFFGLKTLSTFCHELRTPRLWQTGQRQTKRITIQTLAFAFKGSTMFSDVKHVFSVGLCSVGTLSRGKTVWVLLGKTVLYCQTYESLSLVPRWAFLFRVTFLSQEGENDCVLLERRTYVEDTVQDL